MMMVEGSNASKAHRVVGITDFENDQSLCHEVNWKSVSSVLKEDVLLVDDQREDESTDLRLHFGRAGSQLVFKEGAEGSTSCGRNRRCQQLETEVLSIGGCNIVIDKPRTCEPRNLVKRKRLFGQKLPTIDTNEEPPMPKARRRGGYLHQLGCPQHGFKNVQIKRVRKADTCNQYRLYLCCKSKGCAMFRWCDTMFPQCGCGKTSILRVSKTQESGGKWFLSCPKGPCGCGFFEWAQPRHLEPLQPYLATLL